MNRSRAVAALSLALVLSGTACGRYLRAAAAVVDGEPITFTELNAAVDAALSGDAEADAARRRTAQREQLALLIQDRIIQAEAGQRKIAIDPKEVESRYDSIRQQFQTEEELRQALAQQGVPLSTLRERIRLRLVAEQIQQALAKEVKISDREIREAYGTGARFDQFRARHILFRPSGAGASGQTAALNKARAALARIRGGQSFEVVAKAVSEDPGSKERGGDLGLLTRGSTVPEFERAALALRAGQVSEPVRTQFGYHLIQLVSRTKKTLKQATPEIREQLETQAGQDAFQKFLSDRLAQARIEVNPRLGEFDVQTLQVVDRRFYTPATPPAAPEGVPGLQLPPAEQPS